MATTTGLMTFEAFEKLADPPQGRLELHHGEVVHVPPPKFRHSYIQKRLQKLLEAAVADSGSVYVEFPFRTASDYEYWVADIAVVNSDQESAAAEADLDYFPSAPELVVEVLSRPQDASDLYDKEQTCLNSGCQSFWIVDPKNRQIRVSTTNRETKTYTSGASVPVLGFASTIEVAKVFSTTKLPK